MGIDIQSNPKNPNIRIGLQKPDPIHHWSTDQDWIGLDQDEPQF